MEKWILIREWIAMSTLNQLKVTLALIILFQTSTIVFFITVIGRTDREHTKELKDVNREKDDCWQYHIRYVEKNQIEVRDLKEQIDKLQKYENIINNDTLFVSHRR